MSSLQLSCWLVSDCLWPHDYSMPGFAVITNYEFPQTHVHQWGPSVMPSNQLIPCCPLLFLSVFPSIRVFSNELVICIRWPKYWSFSISPSNENPGLISIRMDWLDLLAVQGTLKSLLQHHSSKPSILQHSDFFMAQLLHPYTTIGKNTVLTRQTFVCKVMSLLFNTLLLP